VRSLLPEKKKPKPKSAKPFGRAIEKEPQIKSQAPYVFVAKPKIPIQHERPVETSTRIFSKEHWQEKEEKVREVAMDNAFLRRL
jgi:hypothetical protein